MHLSLQSNYNIAVEYVNQTGGPQVAGCTKRPCSIVLVFLCGKDVAEVVITFMYQAHIHILNTDFPADL